MTPPAATAAGRTLTRPVAPRAPQVSAYCVATATPIAAFVMRSATAPGCDT